MSWINQTCRYATLFLIATGSSPSLTSHISQSETAYARPPITFERASGHLMAANATQLASDVLSPEIAARRLYQAWKKRDRRAALNVATRQAVNDLFQEKWGPMKPGKNFCEGEDFNYTCTYYNDGGGVLEMGIGKAASMTFQVTSVSLFSAAD